MNDLELLELAAKACGMNFDGVMHRTRYSTNVWDPLSDDTDALRLAIELEMNMAIVQQGISSDDPEVFAKQRRAIVKAAAEIGRQMP